MLAGSPVSYKHKRKHIMKKILHITTTFFISLFIVLTVVAPGVHAQTTIDVDEDSSTDSSALDTDIDDISTTDTSDTEETAGVPETGIAPSQGKLLINSAVFIGGAALGAALGFGIIKLRRKTDI